jgi:hypothetical protein
MWATDTLHATQPALRRTAGCLRPTLRPAYKTTGVHFADGDVRVHPAYDTYDTLIR